MAPHPDDLAFVTAGADRVIAKWRKGKVAWLLPVQAACLSAAFHPGGAVVAVGADDGHLVSGGDKTGSEQKTHKCRKTSLYLKECYNFHYI